MKCANPHLWVQVNKTPSWELNLSLLFKQPNNLLDKSGLHNSTTHVFLKAATLSMTQPIPTSILMTNKKITTLNIKSTFQID